MGNLIEYMNTFANYGTLACLVWLVYELRDIRRRDNQALLAKEIISALEVLSKHYEMQERINKDDKSDPTG